MKKIKRLRSNHLETNITMDEENDNKDKDDDRNKTERNKNPGQINTFDKYHFAKNLGINPSVGLLGIKDIAIITVTDTSCFTVNNIELVDDHRSLNFRLQKRRPHFACNSFLLMLEFSCQSWMESWAISASNESDQRVISQPIMNMILQASRALTKGNAGREEEKKRKFTKDKSDTFWMHHLHQVTIVYLIIFYQIAISIEYFSILVHHYFCSRFLLNVLLWNFATVFFATTRCSKRCYKNVVILQQIVTKIDVKDKINLENYNLDSFYKQIGQIFKNDLVWTTNPRTTQHWRQKCSQNKDFLFKNLDSSTIKSIFKLYYTEPKYLLWIKTDYGCNLKTLLLDSFQYLYRTNIIQNLNKKIVLEDNVYKNGTKYEKGENSLGKEKSKLKQTQNKILNNCFQKKIKIDLNVLPEKGSKKSKNGRPIPKCVCLVSLH